MSEHPSSEGLTISQVAARTGVSQTALRVWESRHGFPEPERLPGGHRRYSERDAELVRRVAQDRASGLSMAAAIARARAASTAGAPSLYAALRSSCRELAPRVLPKRVLLAVSHAIEDESCARGARPVLFGSFQRERFYRGAERRWRDMTRTAEAAVVFADFARVRRPPGGPVEVPIDPSDPLAREWSVVCDGEGFTACLTAWELPAQDESPEGDRRYETLWTIEPDVVREAARICGRLAEPAAPDTVAGVSARLGGPARPANADDLRGAVDLTTRIVGYLAAA